MKKKNRTKATLPSSLSKYSATAKINDLLLDLSKKTASQLEFWAAFQSHLADQREIRRDLITEALLSKAHRTYTSDEFVRIVDSRYQNRPLSSYGSIALPPGGRFNFGPISTFFRTFQALYCASDFSTAFCERFLREPSKTENDPNDPRNARLDPGASFSSYRIKVNLDLALDLRERTNLEPFRSVIAEIKAPKWLADLAKKLNQPPPQTVSTLDQLYTIIFDPNFTQWGALLDQPSASQWIGHYVASAGINGIIYPSVRNAEGFSLAIFPETFKDTSSSVQLIDPAAGVNQEDSVLDAKTYLFQMLSEQQIQSFQKQ